MPWTMYFDNRLGLSGEEFRRLLMVEPVAPALPRPAQLLADRADQIDAVDVAAIHKLITATA
jgi:hypothetical protein